MPKAKVYKLPPPALDDIRDKLAQLEKIIQLQSEINGKLIENMNTFMLFMAKSKSEELKQDNAKEVGSLLLLPPSIKPK